MSACTRCGAAFSCAVAEGRDAPCWCMDLPPLLPVPQGGPVQAPACLCPDCLRAALDAAAAPPRQ